ncbi:AI-2E family transporter [Thermococci archaeon]|nr:MAG: AI-2E family transporter [Thermococci archaeon]
MNGESIAWLAISLVVLFLVWKTIEPFVTPIIFGAAIAYILLPLHRKLSQKFSPGTSAILLTLLMSLLAVGTTIGVTLWLRGTLTYLYIYISRGLEFITKAQLPLSLGETINSFASSLSQRIQSSILNYTLSLPLFILQVVVFLGIFYTSLRNADFLHMELYKLIPQDNRELGEALIKRVERTLNAILRTWLLLSTIKGIFLAAGFIMFGISNVSGSIAAGVLCIVLELLPVIGGWIMWLGGSLYLILYQDHILGGVLFAIYGATLISPIPDITIRPKLISQGARINSIVALIGIFGGILAFGFKGLIIGPVSLGVLQTLIEEWKEREETYQAG